MKTSNSIYIDNHWKQKDAYIFDESTHINNGFQGAIAFIWMDFYFIWFSPSPLYYCACNNLNWNRFVFFFYHYFYFFLFFRYIWHKHLAHETVQQGILTNLYSLKSFRIHKWKVNKNENWEERTNGISIGFQVHQRKAWQRLKCEKAMFGFVCTVNIVIQISAQAILRFVYINGISIKDDNIQHIVIQNVSCQQFCCCCSCCRRLRWCRCLHYVVCVWLFVCRLFSSSFSTTSITTVATLI